MPNKDPNPRPQVLCRVQRTVHNNLKKVAKANGRTLAAEAEVRLEQSLRVDPQHQGFHPLT